MKQIVVFASGSGSNFQAIIDATESGRIDAKISGLITNRSGIKALQRAKKHNIPIRILSPNDFYSTQDYEQQLITQVTDWNPDLIVLAGYLKKIPDNLVSLFPNKIINIHPSLLPKYGGKGFYGMRVHKAVIQAKEKESGCTVHFVDAEYDRGDIIAQEKVPVLPDDQPEDLARRVLTREHQLLPEIISKILNQ